MHFSTLVLALLSVTSSTIAASDYQPLFATYPGFGQNLTTTFHYSQTVTIGQIIRFSGQGGWDSTGASSPTIENQIEQAFENIDTALKSAGSQGLQDLVSIKSFHASDLSTALDAMVTVMEEKLGSLKPTWTAIGNISLALESQGQMVEIEGEAFLSGDVRAR